MNGHVHWLSEIGVESAAIHARDFDDLAQARWRGAGSLRYRWTPERFSHVFHFNRVEGPYTGLAMSARLGDSLPALSLVAHGGYAWAEQTARGALALRYPLERWNLELSAGRALDNTNDFVPPLETVATLGALLASVDDFDYVDRTALTLTVTRALNLQASRLLRLELGPARDASVFAHRRRGLFAVDSLFRPNRPASPGSYFREFAALEINPGVAGDTFEPGVGLTLSYEAGQGGLDWQRVDGTLTARRTVGGLSFAGRLDAVAVFGGAPLQRLPEFGANEGLSGYGYKEFGGDRVALLRLGIGYTLPMARGAIRARRWLTLPGLAPTLSAGLQSGWAAALEPGTLAALASFGTRPGDTVPLTRPSNGIRATIAVSLDFFSGAIGVGMARPIDRNAPWRLLIGSAQLW